MDFIIVDSGKKLCLNYDVNLRCWICGYRKLPKFSDTKIFCCKLPKIQTKRPNLRVFCQKHANGIANSEETDQTAPLGAV